jgi:hypothetical protein
MANPRESNYSPGQDGSWAPRGDLDLMKYQAWRAGIKKDYYNHYFYQGVIPLAVDPPDDRDDGGIFSYATLRNANFDFVKFLGDFLRWKADLLEVFTDFFFALPTPLGAIPRLYTKMTAPSLSSFCVGRTQLRWSSSRMIASSLRRCLSSNRKGSGRCRLRQGFRWTSIGRWQSIACFTSISANTLM